MLTLDIWMKGLHQGETGRDSRLLGLGAAK